MADTAESQHSEASPQHALGRWTNLLLAVREALDEWDTGEPFDPDSSRGGDLMDALRGPVAAVDLIEAKMADVAGDLLIGLKTAVALLDAFDEANEAVQVVRWMRAKIAEAELREAE